MTATAPSSAGICLYKDRGALLADNKFESALSSEIFIPANALSLENEIPISFYHIARRCGCARNIPR